jgi:hypothetical protein
MGSAARRQRHEAEESALAAKAQMQQEVRQAQQDAAAAKRAARMEVERAKEGADSRMREYMDRFREQVNIPGGRYWVGGDDGCLGCRAAGQKQLPGLSACGCHHVADMAMLGSVELIS